MARGKGQGYVRAMVILIIIFAYINIVVVLTLTINHGTLKLYLLNIQGIGVQIYENRTAYHHANPYRSGKSLRRNNSLEQVVTLNDGAAVGVELRQASSSSSPDLHIYGGQTLYDNSFTTEELFRRDNPVDQIPPGCEPIQIYMVVRHGTETPGEHAAQDAEKLVSRMAKKHGFEYLNAWTPIKNYGNDLASVGKAEQKGIAGRMAKRFPALFNFTDNHSHRYHSHRYHFGAGDNERCISSAEAFISGLGLRGYRNKIKIREDLTRFFLTCEKYQDMRHDHEFTKEIDMFKDGPEMRKSVREFNERLNWTNKEEPISGEDIRRLLEVAAYEDTDQGHSLLRKLYTNEDVHVQNYLNDVWVYWMDSYAFDVSCAQSCPLLKDIFHHFDEAIYHHKKKRKYYKGVFRFGQSNTIMSILCNLELFKNDYAVLAKDYAKRENNKMRGYRMKPFSSNLGLVLYACQDDGTGTNTSHFRVQLLFRELQEQFPFCNQAFCPYDIVKDYYASKTASCDMDEICDD